MALDRARRVGAFTTHTEFSLGTPTPTLPRKRRAIAYGIFNESSLRTQGPQRERKLRSSRRRGLSFLHWRRGLLSLLRPGVMMVWTAPYGIAMCQNEVVANLRQGSRP